MSDFTCEITFNGKIKTESPTKIEDMIYDVSRGHPNELRDQMKHIKNWNVKCRMI